MQTDINYEPNVLPKATYTDGQYGYPQIVV